MIISDVNVQPPQATNDLSYTVSSKFKTAVVSWLDSTADTNTVGVVRYEEQLTSS